MATRATYQSKSGFSTTTFYIHHDGYAAGAAHYFLKAQLLQEKTNRNFLSCFLWANERSEVISHHGTHSDTEYRYDLSMDLERKWQIIAYKRKGDFGDTFDPFYQGSLDKFIFDYLETTLEAS